jgi:hypothetical protein
MRKLALALLLVAAVARADEPETVMVTVKAKPGQEAQLEAIMKKHWSTIKKLDLVTSAPHTLYRTAGGTFVDIFTWKSADIPDNAPPAVLAIWKEMNEASTKLDIVEVHQVPVE